MATFFYSWYYYLVYRIRTLFTFSKNDSILDLEEDDILEFRDLDNSLLNSSTNSLDSVSSVTDTNEYTMEELQLFLNKKADYIDSVIEGSENYYHFMVLKEDIQKERTIDEIVSISSYASRNMDYNTLSRILDFELSILDKKSLEDKYSLDTITRRTDLIHMKRKLKKMQQYTFYKKAVKRHRDDLRKSITINNIDSYISENS